jgi:hypothetical protein
MKKMLLTVALILFASTLSAQTVVSKASKLAWDDTNPAGVATGFRIYLGSTPGVVPDGVSYVAEVPGDTTEWLISSDKGSYHAVVTLVNDDGVTVIETGPSNEVHYVVPGPPTNAEAVR